MAKILIVEDDEAQRFLYHEELVEEGYEVVLAKNGVEALKCLQESAFDLIVLDIRMPIMNGTEVLGKISSRYKDIPVIIHTAYPEYRNQFISFMVDAFVLKSADLSLLKATLRGLLEKKKQRKENKHGRRTKTLARRNEDSREHHLFVLWRAFQYWHHQCLSFSGSS